MEFIRTVWRVGPALIAVVISVLWVAVMPASANGVQAPGSRVSIALSDKFKPSPLFAGFMDIISSATVVMLEMPPEAYEEVIAGFTAEGLAKKGVMDVKRSKLNRSDEYFFITGDQKFRRGLLEKLILVIRDARNTAVITFNVPRLSYEDGTIKRKDVLAALSTAKLQPKAAPSRDLFTLGYTGPFKLQGSPTGTSRMFSLADDEGPKDTRNILMVAPSLNRLPIRSIKEFSNYALENLNTIKDLKVISSKDHRIDSMSGYEIVAKGKRGASKAEVIVRQLMLLPAAGGYFRMLAVTRATDEPRLAAEIDKIFASFKVTGAGREL